MIYSGAEPGKSQDEPEHFVSLEYREVLNNNNNDDDNNKKHQEGSTNGEIEGSA